MKLRMESLSKNVATSGREYTFAAWIQRELKGSVDEVTTDVMGNVVAIRRSAKQNADRVMITAPMDQPGLMVTEVEDSGFLRIGAIGRMRVESIVGRSVVFTHGVLGVVGIENEKEIQKATLADLFVDIGATSRNEALQNVSIGDACAIDGPIQEIAHNRLMGTALGSRASCAVLLEVLHRSQRTDIELIAVFTTQSEVNHRGVEPAVFRIAPSHVWTVGSTNAGDVIGGKHTLPLGKGPALKVMDRSVIVPLGMRQRLEDVATRHSIPFQREIRPEGHSDAGAVLLSGSGIPVGGLSIPVRYLGSPTEIVDLSDMEQTADLLAAVLSDQG